LYSKRVLSTERDDDKPSSIVVQGNVQSSEVTPTTRKPSPLAKIGGVFRKKDTSQPTIVQGKVTTRALPIPEPNTSKGGIVEKREKKAMEKPKETEPNLPNADSHIYSEAGGSEEFEVVFENIGLNRSDEYSELSDPSKLVKQSDPPPQGTSAHSNTSNESESKLSRFFKRQSIKKQ